MTFVHNTVEFASASNFTFFSSSFPFSQQTQKITPKIILSLFSLLFGKSRFCRFFLLSEEILWIGNLELTESPSVEENLNYAVFFHKIGH